MITKKEVINVIRNNQELKALLTIKDRCSFKFKEFNDFCVLTATVSSGFNCRVNMINLDLKLNVTGVLSLGYDDNTIIKEVEIVSIKLDIDHEDVFVFIKTCNDKYNSYELCQCNIISDVFEMNDPMCIEKLPNDFFCHRSYHDKGFSFKLHEK